MSTHFERWVEATASGRAAMAESMAEYRRIAEASGPAAFEAPTRRAKSKRRDGVRDVKISALEHKMLDAAIKRGSPAFREAIKDLVVQAERKSPADTFKVLAAVFDRVDLGDDILMPGCVKNLPQFIASGRILVGHDWDLWVGDVVSAHQDKKGLHVVGRWRKGPMARVIRKDVKSRLSSHRPAGASIGYDADTIEAHDEWRDGRKVRVITALDVYEVSLTPTPMNAFCEFLSC